MKMFSDADFFGDLDVGAVPGSDGKRAIHRELHVARARGFQARGGDLLAEVRAGNDQRGQRHAIVGQESNFDRVLHARIVVHDVGDVVDELDDLLGRPVSRRSLAGKNIGAVSDRDFAVLDNLQVVVNDVHYGEQLTFVLVNTLDLDVEDGIGIDDYANLVANRTRQFQLVLALDGLERFAKFLVLGEGFEFAQAAQIGDPLLLVKCLADQFGQSRVGLHQPATRSNAVGFVIEFLRPDLRKFRNQRFHQQVAM